MRQKYKWMGLLAAVTILFTSGCGDTPKPGQIIVGDANIEQFVSKQVRIVSDMKCYTDIWGMSPERRPDQRRGLYALSNPYKMKENIFGLNGQWIYFSANENGFTLSGDGNQVYYEGQSSHGEKNFRAYQLTTSNPGLRLWVIAGPNLLPSEIWVLGETEKGFQCYITPEDLSAAGISVNQVGQEQLAIQVVDGNLTISKSHMDKVSQMEVSQGKVKGAAKVTWTKDKEVTIGWDDGGQVFKIGSSAKEPSDSIFDTIAGYVNGSRISENQIESIGEAKVLRRVLPTETKGNTLLAETSNGKKILFSAYRNYFRILSEDGNTAYYTSAPSHAPVGRFLVSEIKVSDPDSRLWSVIFDTGGTTRSYSGYWLIGEHKGVLQVYLSAEDMEKAGLPLADSMNAMKRKGAHILYLTPADGKIKGQYAYEYWPSGVSHSAAKQILDKTFTIGWDKKTQSFQLMDIKEEEPAYIPRGKDPSETEWTPMNEEEVKKLKMALRFR